MDFQSSPKCCQLCQNSRLPSYRRLYQYQQLHGHLVRSSWHWFVIDSIFLTTVSISSSRILIGILTVAISLKSILPCRDTSCWSCVALIRVEINSFFGTSKGEFIARDRNRVVSDQSSQCRLRRVTWMSCVTSLTTSIICPVRVRIPGECNSTVGETVTGVPILDWWTDTGNNRGGSGIWVL